MHRRETQPRQGWHHIKPGEWGGASPNSDPAFKVQTFKHGTLSGRQSPDMLFTPGITVWDILLCVREPLDSACKSIGGA
jgi:hypothetical protein